MQNLANATSKPKSCIRQGPPVHNFCPNIYVLCKKATIDPRVVSTAPRGRRGSRSTPLGKMRSRSNDHYGIYVIPSLYHEGLGVTLTF